MEERLVMFETARLAKEKGFDIPTRNFYADFAWKSIEVYSCIEVGYNEFTNSMENDHGFGDIILIPTQSLLQKWLREVHGIYVESYHDLTSDGTETQYYTNWGFILPITIYQKQNGSYDEYNDWKVYEDALEYGLQEALKMIKL